MSTVSNRATLTLQPNWPQIFRGETITLRCEIQRGGVNKWTYEWTKNNLNTPPTHTEYRIISATEADRGEYRCKGRRDSYSSTEWSDVIKLTVSCKLDFLSFILKMSCFDLSKLNSRKHLSPTLMKCLMLTQVNQQSG